MTSISTRWRLAAAVSPMALVIGTAPAFAQNSQAVITGISSAAAAQPVPADTGATPAPQVNDANTIVVTGFRASLQNAVNKKKQSDQIVESVSAEEIGKLPDASIGEAIARLPGLTAQRLSGRADVISIRGFGPDYSTTLLNGREQTSTGDNRAVQFDQYPAEVINQVNVYKTPMASVIGQGIAGTVDLRTIRPLEYGKQVLSVGARAVYPDLGKLNPDAKKYGYRVNGVFVDQFFDGRFGVAVAASYNDEPYEIEEFNAWGYPSVNAAGDVVVGGLKPYSTSTELKRLGLSGTFEAKLSDSWTSTVDAFYSNFKDDQIKRGVEIPLYWSEAQLRPGYTTADGLVTSGTFAPVTAVTRNVLQPRHAKLYSIGWNNKWDIEGGWHVSLDLSGNQTKRTELVFETYAGTGYNFSGRSDVLGFASGQTGTVITSHNLNYSDPNTILITDPRGWGGTAANGAIRPGYYNNRKVDDKIFQIRPELSKDLQNGLLSRFAVGFNFTNHTKSLTPDESFVQFANPATRQLVLPAQYNLGGSDLGWLGLGSSLAFNPQQLLDAGIYTLSSNNNNLDVRAKAYDVHEKLGTIYAQADIKTELGSTRLTGNIGVQAVHTDQKTNGYFAQNGVITPTTDGASYWDVMPSLNLSARFPSDFVIRAGLAREVMRPRMDSMRLGFSYGYCQQGCAPYPVLSGGSGNPRLRPFRANAADLSFEKYFGTKGFISAQLYYKYFDTFVVEQNVIPQLFNYTGFPLPASVQTTNPALPNYLPPQGITNGFVSQPYNVRGGKMYGAELAATLPFGDFIPLLDGFGMTGGVSYTKSKIRIYNGAPPGDLPGYSKFVANGTLYFEKWGFSARGSVRYRSSFNGEVSGFAANHVFRRASPETIIDAQIGYEFQPNSFLGGLSIYLQGQNLTNEPFKTYNPGHTNQVIDYQVYGRRFQLGANYKFGGRRAVLPPPPLAPPPPPPVSTQTCADGSVIEVTAVCPAPPAPPLPPAPPPSAPAGQRGH